MNCRRCGKSLGTDRGICPFCGASLSKEQMEVFAQDKKNRNPEMIMEKYTGKKIYIEKRENNDSKYTLYIILVIIFIVFAFVCLFFLLSS